MFAFRVGVTLFGLWCLFCVVRARKVFVSAPNLLRLDAEETIAIATDSAQEQDRFTIQLRDTVRDSILDEQIAVVEKGEPTIAKIKITHKVLPDIDVIDLEKKTYVYLVVTGEKFSEKFKLLVSPHSGYIFIQTDKPIYTPQQTVKIRIIPLNEHLLPKNEKVRLQIRNHQNVVVEEKSFEKPWDTKHGIYFPTHHYKFPPHPLLGEWSVIVQYGHKFQMNSTVLFEVAEYILPLFVVKLKVPDVILPDHRDIQVRAVATYVYGKKVEGKATFRFSVKDKLGNIIKVGGTSTKDLDEGEATVAFRASKVTEIVGAFPLESKLVVDVDVVDAATGNREKAISEECSFARSPYHISFKHSQKEFRPGLVSVIMAQVSYLNGKPAAGIPTSISVVNDKNELQEVTIPTDISDENGLVLYNVNTPIGPSQFTITITTNDKKYKDDQQFSETHILSKYHSPGGYVAISRFEASRILKVGNDFSATVYVQPVEKIHNVFYLVLSRGRIVYAARLSRDQLLQRILEFRITPEMVPHVRIVVYGLFGNELITDSIRADVTNICQPKSEVKIESKFAETTPGSEGNIILEGEPKTSVGILAVDSAIYALRNKDRLTKDKLFKTLENDDLGCGPGGGKDAESLLANAGITIFGNFQKVSKERAVLGCIERKRLKREIIDSMANEHGLDFRKCCRLATFPDKYHRTCEERASIVKNFTYENDDGKCFEAFLDCCNRMTLPDNSTDERGRDLGLILEDLEHVTDIEEEEKQASVRKDFRETWLFLDEEIGPDGTKRVITNLPHSITTWVIQAVSVSQVWGMCVSEPKELVAFKKIFLHLHLPYSVIQNEQVEIKATIFNYHSQKVPVTIYMYGVEDLCTGIAPGKRSKSKKITVDPNSATTIGFPVVPLKVKEYTLRFVALSVIGHDVIEKDLRVVAPGAVFEETIPVVLDPSNQRQRKERDVVTDAYTDSIDTTQMLQLTAVKLRATKEFIPGTESCIIQGIGDKYGPTVETILQNPENLIRLPIGCGEQTMMFMGPTVYTLNYLKVKGKLTPEHEAKVYGYIREGYNRELTFRKTDGSYAAWQSRPSSTWLTAFVMKIFCQASKYVFIDENVICTGISWLISKQNNDGSFTDASPVIHWDMMGGLKGNIPMTAFVLISLQLCSCEVPELNNAKLRALNYLDRTLPEVNEPYVLSLVSYALALSDSEKALVTNEQLRKKAIFDEGTNQRHWSGASRTYTIETTAYALLTQVVLNDLDYSLPIINWLNTRTLAGGSFPSTQDTVVALQALSEYEMRSQAPKIDLHCNITYSNDKKISRQFQFQNDNANVLQQFELNKIGGTVFFRTSGSGMGSVAVKLKYNVPVPVEELCKFDVTVNVSEAKMKVKPAVVQENVGKDFFDEIPVGLVRALGVDDDHEEFRTQEDNRPVDFLNLVDAPAIDPRVKNQDFKDVPFKQNFGNEIDDDDNMDNDGWGRNIDDDYDDRDRVGDEMDERDRVGDEMDERDRAFKGKVEKANSKVTLQVTICAKYIPNKPTDMSIIDAGIFSGFTPVKEDLENLLNDPDNGVDRYDQAGRNVIFYLERLPFEKPVCLTFRITREYIVADIQSAVVKVYDYYNPDEGCSIFYRPDSNSPFLRKICEGSVCQCAEGGCPPKDPFSSISKIRNRARDQLLEEACDSHDYVWLGKVTSMQKRDGFIHIDYEINKVLKAGAEQKEQIEGVAKTLLLQETCTSLELSNGDTYLIMGNDGERFQDRKTKEFEYRYVIDQTTIIHKWELIRNAPNKDLQKVLNWLATQLNEKGCRG